LTLPRPQGRGTRAKEAAAQECLLRTEEQLEGTRAQLDELNAWCDAAEARWDAETTALRTQLEEAGFSAARQHADLANTQISIATLQLELDVARLQIVDLNAVRLVC